MCVMFHYVKKVAIHYKVIVKGLENAGVNWGFMVNSVTNAQLFRDANMDLATRVLNVIAIKDGTAFSAQNLSVDLTAITLGDIATGLENADADQDGREKLAKNVRFCQDASTVIALNLWNANVTKDIQDCFAKHLFALIIVTKKEDIAENQENVGVKQGGGVPTVISAMLTQDVFTETVRDHGNAIVNPVGEEFCVIRN